RVDVNADGPLIELRYIHHLVDRLHGIDIGRTGSIKFVEFRGNDLAYAVSSVAVVHTIVLDAQPPDKNGHPTVLTTMVVNAAMLADVPAENHAFKKIITKDQIAHVISL